MSGGSSESGWSYVAPFDGLRAIAVIAVLFFHWWPDVLPGGFIGVDIFFTLSGYLITGMALDEYRRSNTIDLRAFWGRRVRRLLPAVWLLVPVCAVAVWLTDTASFRSLVDSVGAMTWTTNWLEIGFADSQAFVANRNTVLDHLWSLAIEEQFYLVWPPVLMLMLSRLATDRSRLGLTAGLATASILAMAFTSPLTAYFATHTRAFELLAGAMIALVGVKCPSQLTLPAVGVGLTGAVWIALTTGPSDAWMYPGGFVLIAALSSLTVWGLTGQLGAWSAVFTSRPLRRVGVVSYGIYLWHIPVLRLMSADRVGLDGIWLAAVRLAVLALIVQGSYHFVENPVRLSQVMPSRRLVGVTAVMIAVSLVPLGLEAAQDYSHRWDSPAAMPRVQPGDRRILVLGDLLGATVGRGLADIDGLAVFDATDIGCPLGDADFVSDGEFTEVIEYCAQRSTRWRHAVDDFNPDAVVISAGFWDLGPRRVDGTVVEGAELSELYADIADDAFQDVSGVDEVVVVQVQDVRSFSLRELGQDLEPQTYNDVWNDAMVSAAGPGAEILQLPGGSDSSAALEFVRSEVATRLLRGR